MRPNNAKVLPRSWRSPQRVWNMPSTILLASAILGLALLLACGGPPTSQGDGRQPASSGDLPELSDEVIRERINDTRVKDIPEENGTGQPITWRFFEEEPKEITVVEKQVDGTHATVILDVKTQTTPRAREPRALAGRIRTEWELTTGWVLRKWEIDKAENISMKYRNLPKPPGQNSND